MKLSKTNKAQSLSRNRKLGAAFSEHFKGTETVTLEGTSYKVKALQKRLQDHDDAQDAADAAATKWHTAVAAAQEKANDVAGILPALRTYLLNAFGPSSQVVADFGFTPKTRTTTPEVQAEAVNKRAATRKARGTMGKKQRAKITGAPAPVVDPAADASGGAGTNGAGGSASAPKPANTSS